MLYLSVVWMILHLHSVHTFLCIDYRFIFVLSFITPSLKPHIAFPCETENMQNIFTHEMNEDPGLRRIQKNHIEQEIETNWTEKQEVGY